MVKAYARPEKEGFLLVVFYYGADLGTEARYTDWDEAYGGGTPEPRMSVRVTENEGTFDKREVRVVLPNDVFADRAASGVPHSPIFLVIKEITFGLETGDQASDKTLFRGRVVRTVKNFQGQAGKVGFFALPRKSRLDVKMGLPCNHHCANTLFHGGCGVSEATHAEVVEIDSADGTEVTITDTLVTGPGATDARYWKRGYLEKDGLRIPIRDYDGSVDTSKLYMARPVPTDWVGGFMDIRAVPGCDKSVETCRSRYSAEEWFEGLGFAIPAYNPNYEKPS